MSGSSWLPVDIGIEKRNGPEGNKAKNYDSLKAGVQDVVSGVVKKMNLHF